MKRLVYLLGVMSLLAPSAFAQSWSGDHFDVGVFGNFLRASNTVNNQALDLGGLGARVTVKIAPMVQLEAESSYNFQEAYSQGFSDANGTVVLTRSQLRSLDGLIGPKVYFKHGHFEWFVTVKGGFINFNVATYPAVNLQTVTSNFQNLTATNPFAVFYPGGGAETFWGPIGLRVDVGDEIFFDYGRGHNDLKVAVGPEIRF